MYKLYVDSCNDKGLEPVKQSYYRKVFCNDFNISFHQPLKDTCQKCERFNILLRNPNFKKELIVQKELHLRKAEKMRTKMRSCKDTANSKNACITFDLQKTLMTPNISTEVAYYKRQWSTYNLGIHNLQMIQLTCICGMKALEVEEHQKLDPASLILFKTKWNKV